MKKDHRIWLKTECARGRNAILCYKGLHEACGERALSYCTVARWIKAFKEGRQNITHMPRAGHPAVREEDVQTMNALVLADRNATIHELTNDTGLAPLTVLNIWECYEREGEGFLREIITNDETWARTYESQLKRQSNEWCCHGSWCCHESP